MSLIEFNEAELSEMKRFYHAQLAEAEGKVAHLKSILAKLGAPVAVQTEVVATAPVASAEVVEEVAVPAVAEESRQAYVSYVPEEFMKRGRGAVRRKERKSKWATYITNVLRSNGDLMTASEIVNHALRRSTYQEMGEGTVRGGIAASLNRMANEHYRLRTLRVEGHRGRYYGLTGWFEKNGDLKEDFGKRFGKLDITIVETNADDSED
jgi:hypothetical protein